MLRWLFGLSTLIILAPALASERQSRCAQAADAQSIAACDRGTADTRLAQNTLTKAINEDPIIPAAVPQPPSTLETDAPAKPQEPRARPRDKVRDTVQRTRAGQQKSGDQRNGGPRSGEQRNAGPQQGRGVQRIALDPGVLKSDPPPHSMHRGQVVLVDDGSCQKGMIKRVATTRFGRSSYCAPPR
jgi:hypothetical protein